MRPQSWQPTRLPRPWDSPGKSTVVDCPFLVQCRKVKRESEVTQSCPTLSDPMDCSLPGSSAHGIFQARVLELVAIAFSDIQCWSFLKLGPVFFSFQCYPLVITIAYGFTVFKWFLNFYQSKLLYSPLLYTQFSNTCSHLDGPSTWSCTCEHQTHHSPLHTCSSKNVPRPLNSSFPTLNTSVKMPNSIDSTS